VRLHLDTAEVFIPDNLPAERALARTTHLCIAAHADDIEIMAAHAILACFQREDQWFTGVVVTDGRGSPRTGIYERYTDDEMRMVRIREQRKAAVVGEYAAQVMLDYPSRQVKDGSNALPVEDIAAVLRAAKPEVVFTHNPADKHETHVAVALRVVAAIRRLPENERPQKLYGCEVWRDLDWMTDGEKTVFDVSEKENLQASLLGLFDSQISGGKRYDLASLARRRANATYFASHNVDDASALAYAMDLTPLLKDAGLDVRAHVQGFIDRFAEEVTGVIRRVS
jgi:LmbE family N-acetylglucosaminyl deacetylase